MSIHNFKQAVDDLTPQQWEAVELVIPTLTKTVREKLARKLDPDRQQDEKTLSTLEKLNQMAHRPDVEIAFEKQELDVLRMFDPGKVIKFRSEKTYYCSINSADAKILSSGIPKLPKEKWNHLVAGEHNHNPAGTMCGLCDGTYEHYHATLKCTRCGVTGLAENMPTHNCKANQ